MAAKTRVVLLCLAALCLPAFSNVPKSSLLHEKPRQGGVGLAQASHQGLVAANTLIAPGIAGCLCDFGGRARCTGHERDLETGLDYFGARYYSGAVGRFVSADEFPGGAVDPVTGAQVGAPGPLPYADITNPQSLNKYAYVMNNPLRYTDPDGHCVWDLCVGEGVAAYALGAVVVGATTAYLASPQGQESIRATATLIGMAGTAIGNLVRKDDKPQDVPVPNTAPRPRAEKLRKEWEALHGKPWPVDPVTGRPHEADHDEPLADGGSNRPENITPRPKQDHIDRHKKNGDFSRWGRRRMPKAAPEPVSEPVRPVNARKPETGKE
jgi:RHS repeat-associated protein